MSFARTLLAGGGGSNDGGGGHGDEEGHDMMVAMQWLCLIVSFFLFIFYLVMTARNKCGWEVTYISLIEFVKFILEIYCETLPPATVYQKNGYEYVWLRYAEWLLTCPVILIHLSRIGLHGTEVKYDSRTMRLICSDIGTIVFGITAAAAPKPEKWIFFSCGVLYGISTWTNAFLVYRNAYQHIQDNCKSVLLLNAAVFFGSWSCFPLLFLLGPEGNGVLTHTGSIIGHCIVDLLSKNLWGFLAWYLDYKMIRVERKEMYSEALTLKIEESQSVRPLASFTGGSDPNGDNVTIAMLMVDNSGTNEIAEKLQNIFEKIRGEKIRRGVDISISGTLPEAQMHVAHVRHMDIPKAFIVMVPSSILDDNRSRCEALLDGSNTIIAFGPHPMRKKGDPVDWWRVREGIFVIDKLSSEMIKPQMELAVLKSRKFINKSWRKMSAGQSSRSPGMLVDSARSSYDYDNVAEPGEIAGLTPSRSNLLRSMSRDDKLRLIEGIIANIEPHPSHDIEPHQLDFGPTGTPRSSMSTSRNQRADYETWQH